jgi:hypothetical protein
MSTIEKPLARTVLNVVEVCASQGCRQPVEGQGIRRKAPRTSTYTMSTLASQLAGLAKTHVAFTPRGKPSFLYDAQAAGDLDVTTLLASALHGAPPDPCATIYPLRGQCPTLTPHVDDGGGTRTAGRPARVDGVTHPRSKRHRRTCGGWPPPCRPGALRRRSATAQRRSCADTRTCTVATDRAVSCGAGLEELAELDVRIGRYSKTLFGKAGAEMSRAHEDAEVNTKVRPLHPPTHPQPFSSTDGC